MKDFSLVLKMSLRGSVLFLIICIFKPVIFKKSRKIVFCISFIATMAFTFTSVLAVNSNTSNDIDSNFIIKSTEFAVFVSSDGLYMSQLKENNPVMLDKGDQIKLPVISRDGSYAAYIKSDNLYVCNIKTNEKEEVAKNIESYDWDAQSDLIYSTKNTGISMYNTHTKKTTNIINNKYKYYNINCDSKNKIYANNEYEYTKGDFLYGKALGIISYDLDSKSEKLILESKPSTNTKLEENSTNAQILASLGSTPTVSQISNDNKYIYIWNEPNSASTASDITEFAVYDILNNKYIEFNNVDKDLDLENGSGIYALAYKNNISQNPVNSSIVALNAGTGRDMFSNKTLGILNTDNNTFTSLLLENQVSMTPSYSEDGKNILYSGAEALDGKDVNLSLKTWQSQPHNI